MCHYEGGARRFSPNIEHGKLGINLVDVAAYSPSAEADYGSALQAFLGYEFPFLGNLAAHKDSCIEDIMNLLHLEDQLAEKLYMAGLQPSVEQFDVPVRKTEDNFHFIMFSFLERQMVLADSNQETGQAEFRAPTSSY